MTVVKEPIVPSDDQERGRVYEDLLETLQQAEPARLVGPNGEMPVPKELYDILCQALDALAKGRGVTVVPTEQELTTQEAANFLNVSRPHVISLIQSGVIPHRMVGTHRRVRVRDVLAYREAESERRKELIAQMSREAAEAGDY